MAKDKKYRWELEIQTNTPDGTITRYAYECDAMAATICGWEWIRTYAPKGKILSVTKK
jgi:hypothetical protein